eukprot:353969-Amorphochlora_amoeboformis.AAC.1
MCPCTWSYEDIGERKRERAENGKKEKREEGESQSESESERERNFPEKVEMRGRENSTRRGVGKGGEEEEVYECAYFPVFSGRIHHLGCKSNLSIEWDGVRVGLG